MTLTAGTGVAGSRRAAAIVTSGRDGPAELETTASARFFKVLSDPTRLTILRLLLEREHSVGELVEALDAPQSRVSNHLACLRWCGFVEADRVSRRAIYRIADPQLHELLKTVLGAAAMVSRDRCDHLASCTRIGPEWT